MSVFRLLLFSSLFATSTLTATAEDDDKTRIRIGVYDSRAIAIAYAPSRFNPVKEKMKLFEQAKAEGDQQKMSELEDWGSKHQRQLHRQGFSRVPVGDLLAHVKDQMADVARQAKVMAIVSQCDFVAENVEVVDLTDELAALFEPSDKTRQFIRSIRDKPAIDLDDVEQQNQKEEH